MATKLFQYESASVRLVIWGPGTTGTVQSLYSIKRGQGHGRKVMEMLIDFADEKGMNLMLAVGQFGVPDKALTDHQLIKFYESFGFLKWDRENPVPQTLMFRDFDL